MAPRGDDRDPYLSPGEREGLLREVEDNDAATEDARKEEDQQQLLVRLEQGLYLRRRLYAESSSQVATACRHLCEACNLAATRFLQTENLKGAHDLLKRAEQVADKCDADRAITWNNLACYYRRTGKLRTAVSFLERALALEEHTGSCDLAETHLNLCATLSQLQRHGDALTHAQSALILTYEMLAPLMLDPSGDTGAESSEEVKKQVTVLCIAYHNLAVEHEYRKHFEAALNAYTSGLQWAGRFLDGNHQLHTVLRNSADAVKAKIPQGSAALRRAEDPASGGPQQRPWWSEMRRSTPASRAAALDGARAVRPPAWTRWASAAWSPAASADPDRAWTAAGSPRLRAWA